MDALSESSTVASCLLDQMRHGIHIRHESLRTERAYVHWIRASVCFHGLRHPEEMGHREVSAFLPARRATHPAAVAVCLQSP